MDDLDGLFNIGRGRGRRIRSTGPSGVQGDAQAILGALRASGRGRGAIGDRPTGLSRNGAPQSCEAAVGRPEVIADPQILSASGGDHRASRKERPKRAERLVGRAKGGALDTLALRDPVVSEHNTIGGASIGPSAQALDAAYAKRMRPPPRLDSSCMVCNKPVSAADRCWQCSSSCFGLAHLSCMQGWAREHSAGRLGGPLAGRGLVWNCPHVACQHLYPVETDLQTYRCFCGKESDPGFHGFNEPHSCGGVCGRRLDGCNHFCSQQCHRGPCPSCPQTVATPCHCGRTHAVRRCGAPRISCGTRCDRRLLRWWLEITADEQYGDGNESKDEDEDEDEDEDLHTQGRHHLAKAAASWLPLPGGARRAAVQCNPELQEVLLHRAAASDWDDEDDDDDEDEDDEDEDRHGKGQLVTQLLSRPAPLDPGLGIRSTAQIQSQSQSQVHSRPENPSSSFGGSTLDRDPPLIPMEAGVELHPDVAADLARWLMAQGTVALADVQATGRWVVRSAVCEHMCKLSCHRECLPCGMEVEAACRCQGTRRKVPCCDSVFTCRTVCGAVATCGRHACSKVCCDGDHDPCPRRGKPATCGCGAKAYPELQCDAQAPSCGGTCGRLLSCSRHACEEKCGHAGPCGPCPERKSMTCACGATTSLRPCSESGAPFECRKVCGRQLQCGREGHVCKKKCCGGQKCKPCRRACGRMLACGQHRCPSFCHDGPCLPCRQLDSVACACGHELILVPCGDGRRTAPPACMQPCKRPPPCHHETPQFHSCHFGPCPQCTLPCSLEHSHCGHPCDRPCHHPNLCPPCQVPVQRRCVGGHTSREQACSLPALFSCGSPCGNALDCGRHRCQRKCHAIESRLPSGKERAPSGGAEATEAATTCGQCTLPCDQPRACLHPCSSTSSGKCHPGRCLECPVPLSSRCACGASSVKMPCSQLTTAALASAVRAASVRAAPTPTAEAVNENNSLSRRIRSALGMLRDPSTSSSSSSLADGDPCTYVGPEVRMLSRSEVSHDSLSKYILNSGADAQLDSNLSQSQVEDEIKGAAAQCLDSTAASMAWTALSVALGWEIRPGEWVQAAAHREALAVFTGDSSHVVGTGTLPSSRGKGGSRGRDTPSGTSTPAAWLVVPGGSCGRPCSKQLPHCAHRCKQLCHRGACSAALVPRDDPSAAGACSEDVELSCQCGRIKRSALCCDAIALRCAQGVIDPTNLHLLDCDTECEAVGQTTGGRGSIGTPGGAEADVEGLRERRVSKKQKERMKQQAAERALEEADCLVMSQGKTAAGLAMVGASAAGGDGSGLLGSAAALSIAIVLILLVLAYWQFG